MSDIRDSIIDRQGVPERGTQDGTGIDCGDILPAGAIILLRRANREQKTDGGILIPEVHQRKRIECTVISKGPDCTSFFEEGDRVMVSKYGEIDFSVYGQEYMLMAENYVLCKLGKHITLDTDEQDVDV